MNLFQGCILLLPIKFIKNIGISYKLVPFYWSWEVWSFEFILNWIVFYSLAIWLSIILLDTQSGSSMIGRQVLSIFLLIFDLIDVFAFRLLLLTSIYILIKYYMDWIMLGLRTIIFWLRICSHLWIWGVVWNRIDIDRRKSIGRISWLFSM